MSDEQIVEALREAIDRYGTGAKAPKHILAAFQEAGFLIVRNRGLMGETQIELVALIADVIHNTTGTGTGEDGYMRVWVSQHAQEIAQNILGALAASANDVPTTPEVAEHLGGRE